jgi:hypothetical protein
MATNFFGEDGNLGNGYDLSPTESVGGLSSSGNGGGFDPNTFDWGGTLAGAGNFLANVFGGAAQLYGATHNNNQKPTGYGNTGIASGTGQPTSQTGTSTLTIVVAVMFVILLMVVLFMAFKSSK